MSLSYHEWQITCYLSVDTFQMKHMETAYHRPTLWIHLHLSICSNLLTMTGNVQMSMGIWWFLVGSWISDLHLGMMTIQFVEFDLIGMHISCDSKHVNQTQQKSLQSTSWSPVKGHWTPSQACALHFSAVSQEERTSLRIWKFWNLVLISAKTNLFHDLWDIYYHLEYEIFKWNTMCLTSWSYFLMLDYISRRTLILLIKKGSQTISNFQKKGIS